MSASTLHFIRTGSGPTVLFLHGFMGSGDDWLPVTDRLQQHFDCVRVDLPAHGLTPLPASDITANIAWMAEQVRTFLARNNVQHPHLVGYSMGARVALYLALNHPEQFRSLTIESSEPGLEDEKVRAERVQLDRERGQSIRTHGLNAFLDQWYAAPLFKSLSHHPSFPHMLARRRLQTPGAVAKIIEDVSPGQQTNLWPRVSELQMPSLWITGRLDTKYTPIITRAAALAPHSILQIIDEAGHNVHLEQPHLFAHTLMQFLLTARNEPTPFTKVKTP